ncbi:MAG TPA: alpha/beta hydrolase [Beijerinckiaceae bacterium]|nr:alpha/beta hydrolase [Beijerinckiaceae bacterium]
MRDAERDEISVRKDVVYAVHEGVELTGTLYRPKGAGPFPALVALHGGGWRIASPLVYQYLGPWLASHGYVVFAPVYRVGAPGRKVYPQAVHDVRAAVQFMKGKAADFGIAAERIALMGESAGGHLASLVALAGEEASLRESAPAGEFSHLSTRVKAAVTVYGVHDLVQQWRHDLVTRLGDQQIVPLFLGTSPAQDRRLCFEASPISHAIEKNNGTAFLVVWGTADDIVDYKTQSEPFVEALKQAQAFVRTVVVADAPHYWLGDPLDEPGSHSALLAPRLLRFLRTKL